MRVTVSAMLPICHNWQNAYIISLSKGLNRLEGQAAVVASSLRNRASIEDSMAVLDHRMVTAAALFDSAPNGTVVMTELALKDGNWRDLVERVRCIGKPVRLPLVSQTPAPLSCGGTHWSAI